MKLEKKIKMVTLRRINKNNHRKNYFNLLISVYYMLDVTIYDWYRPSQICREKILTYISDITYKHKQHSHNMDQT